MYPWILVVILGIQVGCSNITHNMPSIDGVIYKYTHYFQFGPYPLPNWGDVYHLHAEIANPPFVCSETMLPGYSYFYLERVATNDCGMYR